MSTYTEEIRHDVNALAEDAHSLMADTRHLAGAKVMEARQRLAAALEGAQAICGCVRQRTIGTVRAADHVLRAHPYQAAGLALGIGLLIGFLLTRPKNGPPASAAGEKDASA